MSSVPTDDLGHQRLPQDDVLGEDLDDRVGG
jgi:hypothetical protein